ncbi:MAG: cytochrome P450, partial [Micromonosporaceae bacterium]
MASATPTGTADIGWRSAPRLVRDPFEFLMGAAAQGPGLVKLNLWPYQVWLVTEPDLVQQVLTSSRYIKGKLMDGIRLALDDGLFTADNPAWRRHRALVGEAFARQHFSHIAQVLEAVFTEEVARLDQAAEAEAAVDVLNSGINLNTEIVLRALVGTDLEPQQRARIVELIDEVFVGMAARMWTFFVPPWLPTPGGAAYRRACAELDALMMTIIAQRREMAPRADMLGALLAASDSDGGLTDEQIRAELKTMFVAGNESTATSVAWIVHELINHPDVASRLVAELDKVLAGRVPTIQDLPQLPYLRQVVAEGLRLHPAFPLFFRTAAEPDQLAERAVRAGDYVVVSPWATHRDPRWWDEATTFNPDRFANGVPRPSGSYYPFGVGQRICIGREMAETDAALHVGALFGLFDVAP